MSSKQNSAATGSAIARNSAARLAAVQAAYQMGLNDQDAAGVIAEFLAHRIGKAVDGEAMVHADAELFAAIVRGLEERTADARGLVAQALARRNTDADAPAKGVEPLLHAILLCGTVELMVHGTTEAGVIISDYVNVAHSFYADGAPQLVNAVLDTVNKAVRA